jgi:hypothetical protein
MKQETANKLMIGGILSAVFACVALTVHEGAEYRKVQPQSIPAETAVCVYDDATRRMQIVSSVDGETLASRLMPRSIFGSPDPEKRLSSKNGPPHTIGTVVIVDRKSQTCTIDTRREKKIYQMVQAS